MVFQSPWILADRKARPVSRTHLCLFEDASKGESKRVLAQRNRNCGYDEWGKMGGLFPRFLSRILIGMSIFVSGWVRDVT